MKKKCINQRIADQYVKAASKYDTYTELQCERIGYALQVILNEVEKILLLGFIFALLGKFWEFSFILFLILTVRITLGGMHRKTFWGCFFFSLFFLETVIVMGQRISLPKGILMMIYIVYLLYIIIRGPIQSATKPILREEKRKQFKLYAVFTVSIWVGSCLFIPSFRWGNYIGWTLLLQMAEILIVEGGRVLCKKKI